MVSWILSCLLLATVSGQADCTIVYFGSVQCTPCEKIAPALERLSSEGWDIRMVNAPERPDLATLYKIDNLPTVVMVSNQSKQEVDRVVGAVSYEQLLSRFKRVAARSASTVVPQPNQQPRSPLSNRTSEPKQVPQAPTVRGQSPAVGGFPMLAPAASVAPMVASTLEGFGSALARQSTLDPAKSGAPSSVTSSLLTPEQAIARAVAATVRIKVEEANTTAFGTGTIVDVHGSEALVLTCGHLFREMQPGSQLSVDLFAGTPQETNVFAQLIDFKAEDEDIGLISFTLPVAIEAVEILPRNESLQKGQPAFSFGCDHGQPPTRRDTKIRTINRYLGAANVEIEGAPAVGRSGGGLFDLQGRLIGVCNAANANEAEGIYAAAEVVYSQIERLGMSHLFEHSSPAPIQFASSAVSSPPVQSASFSQAAGSRPSATESVTWPDEMSMAQPAVDERLPSQDIAQAGAAVANSNNAAAQEIICIMRDAQGQSRIVTISGPSDELLNAIQQHSTSSAAIR